MKKGFKSYATRIKHILFQSAQQSALKWLPGQIIYPPCAPKLGISPISSGISKSSCIPES